MAAVAFEARAKWRERLRVTVQAIEAAAIFGHDGPQ